MDPNSLPPTPPARSKRLPIILGGIISFVLLVVVVIYLGTLNPDSSDTEDTMATTESVTETVSVEDVVPLSAAWNAGETTFADPTLSITFDYPSYFLSNVVAITQENKNWAERYKNNPEIKQPLYDSTFAAGFYTPETNAGNDSEALALICDNTMSVSVRSYDNSKHLTLDAFIDDFIEKNYVIDDRFDLDAYTMNLAPTDLPKVGSRVYEGPLGENPVKEVFFLNGDSVYKFRLIGNCDTGEMYTPEAEAVFDAMLKSVSFL